MRGSQGHAGTVPMSMRKDPMIAAAQSIVAIENICTHPEKGVGGSRGATTMSTAVNHAGAIVCTVGEIHSWPGASNVIPGEVSTYISGSERIRAARPLVGSIEGLDCWNQIYGCGQLGKICSQIRVVLIVVDFLCESR